MSLLSPLKNINVLAGSDFAAYNWLCAAYFTLNLNRIPLTGKGSRLQLLLHFLPLQNILTGLTIAGRTNEYLTDP